MRTSDQIAQEQMKQSNLPSVWNRVVDPANSDGFDARKTKPITLEDLGGTFAGSGMRNITITDGKIDMEQLRHDLDMWHNQSLAPGFSKDGNHNFGQIFGPNMSIFRTSNWKEALEEIAKRNLSIMDCWGIIPGCKDGMEGGASWIITDEMQAYVQETLGDNFLGWDNGENDGRWFWQSMRIYPAPVTRKEAFDYFNGWFKPFLADLQNNVTVLCGLTCPHYFAKMDAHRMIGAEFLQGLPSVSMWASWVRGASRQYDILWFVCISVFDMFGYKSFSDDRFAGDTVDRGISSMGIGNPQLQTGPDRGHPIHRLRQVWYLSFMYGASILMPEMEQFINNSILSPIGSMQLNATRFCMKNQDRRGVQYCPVALLLDEVNGWAPPRHQYSDGFYTVWGCMPYEAGDHQIDLVFRELFPGYQDCPAFRDGRGFLTNTPHGDIADVLLSDVSSRVLSRYKVAFVLGEIKIESDKLDKIKDFVESGGTAIWSVSQLGTDAMQFAGIELSENEIKSDCSRIAASGEKYKELPYSFKAALISDAEVLLDDGNGHPIVISKKQGKGCIITIITPFGLSEKIEESHPLIGADSERDVNGINFFDKAIGSPYQLLNGVKKVIFSYIDSLNLVEICAYKDPIVESPKPRPTHIQYVTNVTDEEDKLVITLLNNEPNLAYIELGLKDAEIVSVIDLLHGEVEMPIADGKLRLTLFPSDSVDYNIYILEIKANRPVVRFMEGKS